MAASDQQPINSGFHAKSTALEVIEGVDLTGKIAIVTGGYSGIGTETTRALVAAGASVVVPARRKEAAEAELADIAGQTIVMEMDLAELSSIRRFAEAFLSTNRQLDLLINNAGIMACPLTRVGPGWESQFGVNHLGHMELARMLSPALIRADAARVVALSSTAHAMSDVLWDDPHFNHQEYNKWVAYGQAKTANSLFALGFDAKYRGEGVRAFAVHPGGIFTPLQRHLPEEEMVALGWKNADGTVPEAVQAMFKTPEQGASTTIWAATSPHLADRGGVYCEDCDIGKLADDNSQRWEHVRAWACDEEAALRLWEMSEKMLSED
ncbi:MAG: oxidoreductase [Aquisalinus sp.]|nr:oxidoreductase [Aquisalinus sp.]